MSITFNHKVGQHGNQLFVCIQAAIIAKLNGMNIQMPTNGLVDFRPVDDEVPTNVSRRRVRHSSNHIEKDEHIHLDRGFYQDVSLFNPHMSLITKEILNLPEIHKNMNDVVIHIRLDGFNHNGHNSHIIDPNWYTSILDSLQYNKLFIVMDSKSGRIWKKQNDHKKRYLDTFAPYNPIMVCGTAREDFEFLRSFDTIICSNSTFCFWASFLGEATHCFMPPFWESKHSRLSHIQGATVVPTNYSYINIDTMENVHITFQ